jgi:DNA polymerase-3 subunit epsilon
MVALYVNITGSDLRKGHRITEIAAIEIVDRAVTDRRFHSYCDPVRALDPGCIEASGLTQQFLTGKPKFGEIVNALMLFIGEDPLVIHNAPCDLSFLSAEFERLGRESFFRRRPRVKG